MTEGHEVKATLTVLPLQEETKGAFDLHDIRSICCRHKVEGKSFLLPKIKASLRHLQIRCVRETTNT